MPTQVVVHTGGSDIGRVNRVSIDPVRLARRVFLYCVTAEIVFVLLDYHVNYGRLVDVGAIRRMTNIAREDSLASWFGTTQTLFVALTAWVLFLLSRAGHVAAWRQVGWAVVAAMFTYMAVDDGAQLHERFGTLASVWSETRGPSAFGAFPSFTWQVLFVPVFGIFGLALAFFLWKELRSRAAFALVLSALACLVVAVALDFVEGLEVDHPLNVYTWVVSQVDVADFAAARFQRNAYDAVEHFSRSLEEFLEMLASTLLWVTFLRHIPAVAPSVNLSLTAT